MVSELKQYEPRLHESQTESGTVFLNQDYTANVPRNTYHWPHGDLSWDKKELEHVQIKWLVTEDFEPIDSSPVDPILLGLFGDVQNYLRKTRERKAFIDVVKTTLNGVNSLRQFLKAWPEGESLVPADDLVELNRPTGRNKQKTEDTLDEETRKKLSGTLLVNKLQQGDS